MLGRGKLTEPLGFTRIHRTRPQSAISSLKSCASTQSFRPVRPLQAQSWGKYKSAAQNMLVLLACYRNERTRRRRLRSLSGPARHAQNGGSRTRRAKAPGGVCGARNSCATRTSRHRGSRRCRDERQRRNGRAEHCEEGQPHFGGRSCLSKQSSTLQKRPLFEGKFWQKRPLWRVD